MKSVHLVIISGLLLLTSCKGTRFYWESKFSVESVTETQKKALRKNFDVTTDLTSWHPVYGRHCSGLKAHLAHLFVCWKGNELRIVSSYPGILKGDRPVRKKLSTVNKYIDSTANYPGHSEHRAISEYVEKTFRVLKKSERILMYGKGSLIIKDELSAGEE